jgi:hypothetical protein
MQQDAPPAAPDRAHTRMSVEVSFGVTGAVHLAHSITDAAAGDPAVCFVQLDVGAPDRSPRDAMTGVPLVPVVVVDGEVVVDLEPALDGMTIALGVDQAGLAAVVDYLTGVQRDWQTGNYR